MTDVFGKVATIVVKQIPGGEAVIELVQGINEALSKSKDVDDQLTMLNRELPKWCQKPSTTDPVEKDAKDAKDATNAVDEQDAMSEVREMVEKFHAFVQDKIRERSSDDNRKLKSFIKKLRSKDNEVITARIDGFKQGLQLSMYRVIIDNSKWIKKTHEVASRVEAQTTVIVGGVREIGGDVSHLVTVTAEIGDDMRDLKGVLEQLIKKSGEMGMELSNDDIELIVQLSNGNDDARKKLLQSCSGSAAPARLLRLSLELVRLNDDDAKQMGLLILDDLLNLNSDDLNGPAIINDALIPLIKLARGVNERVKERASKVLEKIAKKFKAQFFGRVCELSVSEEYKQAIAETIVRLIVDCARTVCKKDGTPARVAFDVLRRLANADDYRPAIAHAEGIPALVEIYKGTAESMTRSHGPESAKRLATTNEQAVATLILLTTNDESRRCFTHETIWPLVDYIRRAKWKYRPCVFYEDDDSMPSVADNVKEVDPSDQQRVQDVGKALWRLSLIDEFKSGIISLSKVFAAKSINDIGPILQDLQDEAAVNGFDALSEWRKNMGESEMVQCDQKFEGGRMIYPRSQRDLFWNMCASSRNLLWSMVLDDETAVAVAACWYSETRAAWVDHVDPEYWVKSVLYHVDLSEKESCITVPRCLDILVTKLGDKKASSQQQERAVKVLWFCSLAERVNKEDLSFVNAETIRTKTPKQIAKKFSAVQDDVAKRCADLVRTGTPAQTFWATGILVNLPKSSQSQDFTEKGAQRIVATESEKYAFLAQYVDRQSIAEDEGKGTYFDSSFYADLRRRESISDSESSSDAESEDTSDSK